MTIRIQWSPPEQQQFPLSLILPSRQSFQHETVENKAKTVSDIWWNIADLAQKLCEKKSAETSQPVDIKQ